MTEWNFADVWEAVADAIPDADAQIHGDRRSSWSELDRRADGIAGALLTAGLEHQDRVALLLFNGPEYMESAFATLKAGLVPVNTNYRYGPDELHYVWDDAAVNAVVFHGELTDAVAQVRERMPGVALWLHVDDGTTPCPDWADPYEQAATSAGQRVRGSWGRSGDDLLLIYTGGTTGRPKGLMWRQHDMYRVSDVAGDPQQADLDHVRTRVTESDRRPVGLPAAPMMHGTGYVFAGTILSRGGTLVTLSERRLNINELLGALERERVTALCIVGDAFCHPLVEALDAEPDKWDVSALRAVSSSGMAWSSASKERLLAHAPKAILVDMLNSSEASGMGRSITSKDRGGGDRSSRFKLGKQAFVVDDEGRPLQPGSDAVGRVAVRGHLPLGYWNDPEKTAETFPEIDGERCSLPGDLARLEADGSITLLGRDSTTINTGGEKVHGEEVEEVLKQHPDVVDAIVVGVPDERFGSVVAAVVQPRPGAAVGATELVEHTRERLARYKAPRHILLVESVERQANGKPDLRDTRARLEEALAKGDEPPILSQRRDGIAYVTLNRPEKHNALTPEMIVRLADLWEELADDRDVRVVLLTGAGGRAFSTGGDLGSLIPIMMRTREPENEWEERLASRRRLMHAALLRNDSFYKPVVAAVHGRAYAGGMEMLLSTDIRVASTDATFALTEVRRGLIAGGGSLARLARQLAWVDAMEIALVGEPIDAEHALRIGLVNRVVASEEVLGVAESYARAISAGAPIALAKTKEAIVRSSGRPLTEAFEIETECTVANARTQDAREGPRAFMEKRDPVFEGR